MRLLRKPFVEDAFFNTFLIAHHNYWDVFFFQEFIHTIIRNVQYCRRSHQGSVQKAKIKGWLKILVTINHVKS